VSDVRILLAGVPFGCDNVGDEAILACAVAIFKKAAPQARITVSTSDPVRTAPRLDVETCGLLGFFGEVSREETERIIREHDWFIWCGATGLSDYPQVTTELMLLARSMGKKTLLWCVGMNSELSPAFHRVGNGRKRRLLEVLQRLSLGQIDTVSLVENRRVQRSRQRIAACLNAAAGVFVRDTQSRDEVLRSGVTRDVVVGADSAIRLQPAALDAMKLAPGLRAELERDETRVGLCVSAQGAITDERALAACLDSFVEERGCRIIGIPMNPFTDSALMARLAARMKHRDQISVLTGEYEPDEILAIAARMNVIISSRLHLLILASTVHVPIVGVSRGSKVDNFLSQFGLHAAGSVDDCDFGTLRLEVLRLLDAAEAFRETSIQVRSASLARLDSAESQLAELLSR
jgi:polysaccharide pyruvyl transferase WcaK-like protein